MFYSRFILVASFGVINVVQTMVARISFAVCFESQKNLPSSFLPDGVTRQSPGIPDTFNYFWSQDEFWVDGIYIFMVWKTLQKGFKDKYMIDVVIKCDSLDWHLAPNLFWWNCTNDSMFRPISILSRSHVVSKVRSMWERRLCTEVEDGCIVRQLRSKHPISRWFDIVRKNRIIR